MRPQWNVCAGYTQGKSRFTTVCRTLSLVCVILCGMAVAQTAQDERAVRRIVVADRQTAQEILQQLQQGASFSALAGTRSVGSEFSQWGYSGTVRPHEVQPVMRTALLTLQEGQISDVLEVEGQFVILKISRPKSRATSRLQARRARG